MTVKEYLLELKKYSQYDFSEYSDNSIQRRLKKILEEQDLTMDQLYEKTKQNPVFVELLVNEITVNTTEFFRDPEVWVEYVTTFLDRQKNKKSLNIWHAGSSLGHEVYSNLMLLESYGYLNKCNVVATDINQTVINESKAGHYRLSTNIKNFHAFNAEVQKSILTEHPVRKINFEKYIKQDQENDLLKIDDQLIKVPNFFKHDLVSGVFPHTMKFDVIFCRNVMIYFNTNLQSKILKLFHSHMNNGGILILGNHEGVSGFFKTRFKKNGNFYVKSNTFHFKD